MIDMAGVAGAVDILTHNAGAWLVVLPGLLIGLIFGAVPGLSISIGMAIFLPLTLYMDFLQAILFLTAIFTGGGFGCAIPAILMNIPGTSAAVATTFDGYPMARRGEHNIALGAALAASTIGTGLSYLVLFLFVSPIASVVLRLGPSEMFVVAIWGMSLIAVLRERYFARGLLAGVLGLLIGTIGVSALGSFRGTMGSIYLFDGVPAIPALIGLFAASELFNLIRTDYLVADEEKRRLNLRGILAGVRLALRYPVEILRGGVIGSLIGAIPGVGSSVANLVSYADAKRRAGAGGNFGKGDPRGVIASESANSSSEGGSMATLLALGIPGGGGTAIMLAAFATHNVTGGPRFLADNTDVVYAIIFGNLVQVILLLIVGLGFIFVASAIVKVPLRLLVPTVMMMALLGSYAYTGSIAGPVTVAVFSALGWVMRRYEYPVAATVIGILLGGMIEGEMLRTYQLASGQFAEYVMGRPVTLILLLLLAASLALPAVRTYRQRNALLKEKA
ncbi:tripartite tricarboxylate transporter permease [Futiania mangrovi]|uniref:Tripartite tricarboxylate transporter permease n=1 Tax=Futiania mangrovi TaxID=2959716 RepID=A0A9J6PCG3_9PROT|nr:tripartite tricarboxylate transporter permease [Futiania mangrovii]MCP1337916.1 tripartite tricarboxylate transporter permease [Futiania mangrovii]